MKLMPLASLSLLLMLMACHTAPSQTREDKVIAQAKSLLGNEVTVIKNKQSSFALCLLQKAYSVDYLVIRTSDLTTVEQGTTNGSVTWSGEMEIKVTSVPGMVKKENQPEDNSKIIDLRKHLVNKN